MPSAAAIAAYEPGSRPCSCTSRAPNSESTIAISTKPTRSRTCGEPRAAAARAGRVAGRRLLVGRGGTGGVRLRSRALVVVGGCDWSDEWGHLARSGPRIGSATGRVAAGLRAHRGRRADRGAGRSRCRRRAGRPRRSGRGRAPPASSAGRAQQGRGVGRGGGAQPLLGRSAAAEPDRARALRDDHAGLLGQGGEVLGVAQLLQLVVQGLLAGGRGCRPAPRARWPRTTPAASGC